MDLFLDWLALEKGKALQRHVDLVCQASTESGTTQQFLERQADLHLEIARHLEQVQGGCERAGLRKQH